MSDDVKFVAILSESDWQPPLGGWHCSALALPGAEVTVTVNGIRQDQSRFEIDPGLRLIRWLGNAADRPTLSPQNSTAALIKLTKKLTTTTIPIAIAIIGAVATLGSAIITAAYKERSLTSTSTTTIVGTSTTGTSTTGTSTTGTSTTGTTTTGTTTTGTSTTGTTTTGTTTTGTTTTATGTAPKAKPPVFPIFVSSKIQIRCQQRSGKPPWVTNTGCMVSPGLFRTPPPNGGIGFIQVSVPYGAEKISGLLTEYSGTSCNGGSAQAYILADGKVIWTTHQGVTTDQPFDVQIPPSTKMLEFRVDALGDPGCDDPEWRDVRFLRQ